VWEVYHPERALRIAAEKAPPGSPILHKEFIAEQERRRKAGEREATIGGRPWNEVLLPVAPIETYLIREEVLGLVEMDSKGEERIRGKNFLVRVWEETGITPEEVPSAQLFLAEIKKRVQAQKTYGSFEGSLEKGRKESLARRYVEVQKAGEWARREYLRDMAREVEAEFRELGLLDRLKNVLEGGDEQQKKLAGKEFRDLFNRAMASEVIAALGIDTSGMLRMSELATAKVASDLEEKRDFLIAKDNLMMPVDLVALGEWIEDRGVRLPKTGYTLDFYRKLLGLGPEAIRRVRERFLGDDEFRDLARQLAWGEVPRDEIMERIRKSGFYKEIGSWKNKYNLESLETLRHLVGWS
jgi:hypothetical protein